MPAREQLNRLAALKSDLRVRIAAQRIACAAAAAPAVRALAWVDHARAFWQRVSPLANLALHPFDPEPNPRAGRSPSWSGRLLRWAPLALGAVQFFRSRRPRASR